jgi:hypothetical protein
LDGSHDDVSFFSAPVSFPDSGPASTTSTSQNTSISHFVLRPAGAYSNPRIAAMAPLPSSRTLVLNFIDET